ncbi:MAG: hypothetical protein ACKV2O_20655 [Acidimicrobiales bacterium]
MTADDDRSRTVLRYTARSLPLATVAVILTTAAMPTVWTVARGRSSFGLPLVAASFIGTLAAFAVDDPAGELTAASVVPLWRRRVTRLLVVGLPGCAVWAVLLVVIVLTEGDPMSSWAIPTREIVTIGAIAFGLAGLAHRRDERSAALAGAFGSALATLLISTFAFRYRWLPSLGMIDHHERWWFAAGIGIVAAALSSRDAAVPVHRFRFLDRSDTR